MPCTSPDPISRRAAALYSVSTTNVDFPPPDTPVTQVNVPKGNPALIDFRLLPRAFTTRTKRSVCTGRRSIGTSIRRRPARKSPVNDLGFADTSAGVPSATTSPPSMPAAGPMSIR